MRPLTHPAIEDVTVTGLLHALSDPIRVQIFKEIMGSDSPRMCSEFLNTLGRTIPKATLSQHFKVLREAGLIRSERIGVKVQSTARHEELEPRFGQMIASILAAYSAEFDT
ncbi:ArsR/SmtB family transcription factor [Salidesulfovibrio onnuriiensis]|uniref:ArsR/SmtB family transcription factor n=1 Tax=Salidesulfovibrio onnuriiensis TaxID=2583823 RepID=UPI0011C99920|nr:helix-turn-helix domain-containing protein [Salidesulfovibrio onnuriiensis]